MLTPSFLPTLLPRITRDPWLHARWLNSLSLMENSGARKISAGMHATRVQSTVLKHAAEEARHAYLLKSQIRKVLPDGLESYDNPSLLAPRRTRRYLDTLDARVCRYLGCELGIGGEALRYAAYLLVTTVIELRAQIVYPCYQEELQRSGSPVQVKSILAEETAHLEEMVALMERLWGDGWKMHAAAASRMEEPLFEAWVKALESELALS